MQIGYQRRQALVEQGLRVGWLAASVMHPRSFDERWDAVVVAERPGVWAFHCHILPHVEGLDGIFGMVTALVVLPA